MSARFREYRNWIAPALALVAIAEIIVLALRAYGVDGRTRLGPFVLSIHSVYRPLWIGLGASAGLLVCESRPAWRACAFASMAAAVTLAIVVLARVAPSIVTKSDIAVTELYVQLAATGRLLDGPYSRFGWHHPGPLYFWLQVPFYEVSGQRGTGLYAGALALNLAAFAVLASVLLRVNDGAQTVGILAAWVLFAWRDRFTAASPWTGHIPVLPAMTFVVLAAAVATGRRWMLVPLVFFGSLMTQSHVAVVPLVAVLASAAVATLIATRGRHAQRLTAPLQTSAWLLALLWLPVIAEQMSHEPGNLARLWDFFAGPGHTGKSLSTAFSVWSYAIVGALRRDLYTPYGGHFELTHLRWGIPLAIGQVVALGFVGARALRRGLQFEAAVALAALLASVVALWSITRVQGDIVDHEIFWISPLGAVNLGIIAGAALRRAGAVRRMPAVSTMASVLAAPLMLACVYTAFRDFDRLVAFESNRPKDAVIAATFDSVQKYLTANDVRKPLFRIAGMWDIAAGVLLRLHTAHAPFAVEDSAVVMFTETFSAHGDEDSVITIGGRGVAAPPGNRSAVTVVQDEPVYVEAYRLPQ